MKKSIYAVGLALVALAAFVSCSKKEASADAGSSSEQKIVRINFSTGSLCHAPVHVAMKLGLFDEELEKIGQKAEYVQVVEGGATLGEMIASGNRKRPAHLVYFRNPYWMYKILRACGQ